MKLEKGSAEAKAWGEKMRQARQQRKSKGSGLQEDMDKLIDHKQKIDKDAKTMTTKDETLLRKLVEKESEVIGEQIGDMKKKIGKKNVKQKYSTPPTTPKSGKSSISPKKKPKMEGGAIQKDPLKVVIETLEHQQKEIDYLMTKIK
tara:strand:+ start:1314 stop:1751 length:438 start_codon:yes stop_codon:yes gene_type:complete